ncbi:hypothetical protein PT2222_250021 [Paraburkholderia tropica]
MRAARAAAGTLLQVAVQERGELRLRQGADLLRRDGAVLEEDQRGDAAHAELHRRRLMFVDVDLRDLQTVAIVLRDFVENRRDHLAGAAPFGPEVQQDGLIGFNDVLFERCVADVLDLFAHCMNTSFGSRLIELLATIHQKPEYIRRCPSLAGRDRIESPRLS